MQWLASAVGLIAAAMTSLSYIPQVRKALPRGSTTDLSLGMLSALWLGLVLWVLYGVLSQDVVVIVANIVAAALVGVVLGCKLRDR